MNKSIKWLTAASLILCVVAVGCSGNKERERQAEGIEVLLEQSSGDQYEVMKVTTRVRDFSVFRNKRTGEYLAINVSVYQPGMTIEDLYAALGSGGIVRDLWEQTEITYERNPFFDEDEPISYYNQPYREVYTTIYTGHGYIFEQGSSYLKDLETMGANLENADSKNVADMLSSQYGLSEERSMQVARLVSNWSSLSKSRSMTEADLKEFSSEILGADLASFQRAQEKARTSGDNRDLDRLIEKAADVNEISPEHARQILKGMLE